LALSTGLFLARLLPAGWMLRGGALAGRLAGRFSGARGVVRQNLRRIERERSRRLASDRGPRGRPIAPGDVFASYGRYWGEFLVLAARPHLMERFDIRAEGIDFLEEAARRGPVCVLTGHFGNWDLGARWLERRLSPLVVTAERLHPPGLSRCFRRIRERGGARVIYASEGGRELFRHFRRGGHAALVADRTLGAAACEVSFLGAFRRFPTGGVRLAARAGAAILPAFLRRDGPAYVVRFHPPVTAETDPLRGFATALETEILQHAEQWCVLGPLEDGIRPPGEDLGE